MVEWLIIPELTITSSICSGACNQLARRFSFASDSPLREPMPAAQVQRGRAGDYRRWRGETNAHRRQGEFICKIFLLSANSNFFLLKAGGRTRSWGAGGGGGLLDRFWVRQIFCLSGGGMRCERWAEIFGWSYQERTDKCLNELLYKHCIKVQLPIVMHFNFVQHMGDIWKN